MTQYFDEQPTVPSDRRIVVWALPDGSLTLTTDRGELDLVMLEASRYQLPLLFGAGVERLTARQLGLNTEVPTLADPAAFGRELSDVASASVSF